MPCDDGEMGPPRRSAAVPGRGGAQPGRRAAIGGLAVVAAAIVTSILPVFLLGTLSVEIRTELGYGETVAGVVLATFFAASAIVSSRLGRWVDRRGPRVGLVLALSVTTIVQLALAAAPPWPVALALFAAIGGVANATSQLSANVYIARYLPLHRQGIGFAVKQSAMPGASLVAGLLLPSVALTLGWRWVFVVGAGLSAVAMLAVRIRLAPAATPVPDRAHHDAGTAPPQPSLALVALAVAAALATGAAISLGGFYVESALDAGVDVTAAGLAFAAGSVVSIIVRLAVGTFADRRQGTLLGLVAAMLALGATSALLFSWRSPIVQLIGVPIAFGAGWAWPGLFNLSVVRAHPGAPGRATGITQTGTYVGAAVGPVVFGAVAESAGYRTGWLLAATLGLAASAAVLVARRVLRRETGSVEPPWVDPTTTPPSPS